VAFLFWISFFAFPASAQITARAFSLTSSNEDFINLTDHFYDNGKYLSWKRGHLDVKKGEVNYEYWFIKRIDSATDIFVHTTNPEIYGVRLNGESIKPLKLDRNVNNSSVEKVNNFLVFPGNDISYLVPISLNTDSIRQFEYIKVSPKGLAVKKDKKYAIFDSVFTKLSDYVYDRAMQGNRGWSVKQGNTFKYISFDNKILLDSLDDLYYDEASDYLASESNRKGEVYKYIDFDKNVIWQGAMPLIDAKKMWVITRDPATKKVGVIDSSKKQILPAIYDAISYRNGLFYVTAGLKAMYLRPDGTEFSNITNVINDTTFFIRVNDKFGIVDSANTEIFAPQFDELTGLGSIVRVGNMYGYLSNDFRNLQYPISFQYITNRSKDLVYLQKSATERELAGKNKVYKLKESEFVIYDNNDIDIPQFSTFPSRAFFESYIKAMTYFNKKSGRADFVYDEGTSTDYYRISVTAAGTVTRTKIPYSTREGTGSQTPQPEGFTKVYSADDFGNRGTKILYYIKGGVVYSADDHNNRTDKILRYIVGDKVYAADNTNGQRTDLVLYYIVNNIVYAADLNTRQRTDRILEYISENVVYSADASSGQRTNRKLRYLVGNEKTN
jgi:hypothetical protein